MNIIQYVRARFFPQTAEDCMQSVYSTIAHLEKVSAQRTEDANYYDFLCLKLEKDAADAAADAMAADRVSEDALIMIDQLRAALSIPA